MAIDPMESRLWQDCHQLASELEAFDPRLFGIDGQISRLEQGQPVAEAWLFAAREKFAGNPILSQICVTVNQIAGMYFARREFHRAQMMVSCAYEIHSACLGSEDEASKAMAQNLAKLEDWMRPARLPKLWDFSRKRKDEGDSNDESYTRSSSCRNQGSQ